MIDRGREIWRQQHPGLLMLYRGVSDVAAKAVMFGMTVAAARVLAREAFGQFALATTVGWLGAVAADMGIQVHLARAVAQHPDRANGLLRRWLIARIAVGAVAVVLSLITLRVLSPDPEPRPAMYLFALAYAANGFGECVFYFFRGLGRTDLESTFTLVNRLAMGLLVAVAIWWRPTLTLFALAMLAPAVGTLFLGVLTANQISRPLTAPLTAHHDPRREFLTSVAPIGIGMLLSALYFRIDVLLLERWAGSSQVALYNAVYRIIDALRLVPAAALAVALPTLCRARDAGPLVRVAGPLTVASAGSALVLWFLADWLVTLLYGASFAEAAGPFRILLLAVPLMALNYALTQQLIGWHGHRAYAVVCGGALLLNILLNARLIPALGMTGAAWATLWTEAFLTLGCAVALARSDPAAAAMLSASPARPAMERHR